MTETFRKLIPTLMLAVLIAYFSFHAMTGDQGMLKWAHYQQEISVLNQELQALEREYMQLLKRVQALSDTALDADLVDEEARRLLDYAHDGDIVIRLTKSPTP